MKMKSEKSTPTSVGTGTNFDKKIWEDTIELIKNEKLDTHEIIENFILFLRRVNLSRFIAQYEVFKKGKVVN